MIQPPKPHGIGAEKVAVNVVAYAVRVGQHTSEQGKGRAQKRTPEKRSSMGLDAAQAPQNTSTIRKLYLTRCTRGMARTGQTRPSLWRSNSRLRTVSRTFSDACGSPPEIVPKHFSAAACKRACSASTPARSLGFVFVGRFAMRTASPFIKALPSHTGYMLAPR